MITIGVATVTTAAQAQSFVHVEKPENKGLFGILYKALGCSLSIFLVNQQPCLLQSVQPSRPCICCGTKCTGELSPLTVNQTYQESLVPPFPSCLWLAPC